MSSPALDLVIDARPHGPRGLLAAEVVLGRALLCRLVDQALEVAGPGRTVAVHARSDERDALESLLVDAAPGRIALRSEPPSAEAAILRTDRLYDSRRLRRALRRGERPEAAEIWRLDRPESLAAAEQELTRRLTYQPLGRYWAFPIAERIAAALQPTRIRPNAVTLAAAVLMLGGTAIVGCGGLGWIGRTVTALAFAAALVLDTADGRLARLQGTCSAFGQWLDQVLDELADLALHGAISWAMFQSTASSYWLVLGLLYASGKYMFLVQSLTGAEMEEKTSGATEPPQRRGSSFPLRGLVAAMGHADLRWHLWIVLALVGRLDLALAAYAAYFPLRAVAGIARKGAAYA
jgi:phosphatidylglycerophosphate synthase